MDPPPSPVSGGRRTLTDLDSDSLAHCAAYLKLQDVSTLSMTCRFLRQVADSDAVWSRLYREQWPQQELCSAVSGVKDRYLARRAASLQFKFLDPVLTSYFVSGAPCSQILLHKDDAFLSQGSSLHMLRTDASTNQLVQHRAHNARITCMRLFPLSETSFCQNSTHCQDTVLVTSSADHTIRLWRKEVNDHVGYFTDSNYDFIIYNHDCVLGRPHRCFKGHGSPVTTLVDRLLGNCGVKVLASGGEDGTVRLWSFSSIGKRQPLISTFYGHEKPISLLSVSGHNSSLLVSVSKDAKIRVWDTSGSSSRSSCVGMSSVSGQPVAIRCHEAMCYVGAGSFITAIDLRTMNKAFIAAAHPPILYSFQMLPSKSLICTGGQYKAKLWDIRNHGKMELADLEGHVGQVALVHMDSYKVVTGGPHDPHIKVWETDTGAFSNSSEYLISNDPEDMCIGLSAMAVDGCRIMTARYGEEPGRIYLRDFSDCCMPTSSEVCKLNSKFWEL